MKKLASMHPYRRSVLFLLSLPVITLLPQLTAADIIQLKDGREIKGIVIEEYKDRIIFSTPDGETKILKSDIKELSFDDEETNLIKLGDQARDNQKYMKAVGYYSTALKLNPRSKQAKDGLIYLQLYLSSKRGSHIESDMRRQDAVDQNGSSIAVEKSEEDSLEETRANLAKSIGLTLSEEGGLPKIGSIRDDSLAYNAGMRKGDILIAIWGRLTGYMTIKEVADHLLKKTSKEIRCTIERLADVGVDQSKKLFAGPEGLIGASLGMEFDGLTVRKVMDGGAAYVAGLKTGDLIVAIDSKLTRYMPLKKAIEIIRGSEDSVSLSLRRDVVIWRKD